MTVLHATTPPIAAVPADEPPPPAPPEHLAERGRALWRAITDEFPDGWGPGELQLLTDAAGTTDLIARLEDTLATADVTVDGSTGQTRCHPAVSELRLQRGLLAAQLRQLNLPRDDDPDAATPGAPMSRSEAARKAANVRHGNR